MPEYSCRYRSTETGRWRKRKAWAENESGLRAAIEAEGALEIADIKELPPEMATQSQLDYLRDLGADVGGALTRWEASDCIDNAKRRWRPAGEAERRLGERYGLEFTRFASKHRIYDTISVHLADGGEDAAFAGWFVWRVYRNCFDRSHGPGIASPDDPLIDAVARPLCADGRWLENARRSARDNRTGLRWFGEINGERGESDGTIAYKEARKALRAAGLIPARRQAPVFDAPLTKQDRPAARQGNGLVTLLVLVVMAVFLFWLLT